MVYAAHTAVSAWLVGACRELVHTHKFVDGYHKLCAELESVVSDRRVDGHPQRGMKRFTKMVGSTFSCEFRGGDSEHIRPPAETVYREKDVGISSGRDQQGPKIVNTDGYPGAIRQWGGECRPEDSLARRFSRPTLEAASYPPFYADFHTDPPVEAFQHFECACDTEATRGTGVAFVHDPRSGQVRHVDANGIIKGGTASTAVVGLRRQSGGNGFPNE